MFMQAIMRTILNCKSAMDMKERPIDQLNLSCLRKGQTGMILAIEMVKDKARREPYPWQERRGLRVYRHGLDNGVLLRPLGNVVYFMPPYVISEEEIGLMARVAAEGIDKATRE